MPLKQLCQKFFNSIVESVSLFKWGTFENYIEICPLTILCFVQIQMKSSNVPPQTALCPQPIHGCHGYKVIEPGMLAKCRDLRASTHVGEMSRFTHFAGHKILAAGHFQLFYTPGHVS